MTFKQTGEAGFSEGGKNAETKEMGIPYTCGSENNKILNLLWQGITENFRHDKRF